MGVSELPNMALCLIFHNTNYNTNSSEVWSFLLNTLLKSTAELDKLKENAVSYRIQQFTIIANKILPKQEDWKENWN